MLAEIPKNFAVKRQGDELCLIRHWQGFEALLFGAGALLFASLSLLMYLGHIEIQNISYGSVNWYLLLVLIVGLAYLAVAFTLNKTVIWVTPKDIRVSHQPLPVPRVKNQRVAMRNVDDFEVKKVVARNSNSASVYYQLLVRLNGGNTVILLTLLSDENQAGFIAQSIKDHLKL